MTEIVLLDVKAALKFSSANIYLEALALHLKLLNLKAFFSMFVYLLCNNLENVVKVSNF